MPLLFFIDRDIMEDPLMADVDDVVLSYTFFKYVLFFYYVELTGCGYICQGATKCSR